MVEFNLDHDIWQHYSYDCHSCLTAISPITFHNSTIFKQSDNKRDASSSNKEVDQLQHQKNEQKSVNIRKVFNMPLARFLTAICRYNCRTQFQYT